MVTFTNKFHNTEITINAMPGDVVSYDTYKKVVESLCGMADCQCNTFNGSEFDFIAIGPSLCTYFEIINVGEHYPFMAR